MDSCWITTNEIWVNEFDSKITQLNPDIHITIWLAVEIISYLSIDELKGLFKWMVHKAQHLVKVLQMRLQALGLIMEETM